MSRVKVTFFSATGLEVGPLSGALASFRELGGQMELNLRTQAQLFDASRCTDFVKMAQASEVVVLNLHGGPESFPAWREFEEAAKENQPEFPIVHVQPEGGDLESLEWSQKISSNFGSQSFEDTRKYLAYGGLDNLIELLKQLSVLAGKRKAQSNLPELEPAPPKVPAFEGLYHPLYSLDQDEETYFRTRIDPAKPTVGIWFYQTFWLNRNLGHIDQLITSLESRGVNVVCVFHMRYIDKDLGNPGAAHAAARFFTEASGRSRIDALLSPMSFSLTLTCPDCRELFEKLGIPVIQATTSSAPKEVWEASPQGLATMDVALSAAQPEFDGNIISVPFAFRQQSRIDPLTKALLVSYEPDPERCAKLVDLAVNWAKLRRVPNADKKIAVSFHHYPPRNDRIGCAAGLDSFKSVVEVLKALKEAGYDVPRTFEGEDELAKEIVERLTSDRRYLTPEAMSARAEARAGADFYRPWHEALPEAVKVKMISDWGPIPGELFVYQDEMLFSGLACGNVFITIQPTRGYLENIEKVYHDFSLSPPHQYLAHYRWLKEVWGAMAVIHVGKHGSLEWLPGKSLGLSRECYPDLSIMDLPNIYPYIINDPGEGTQAKRRSYAVIIDHLTPALTSADLYDELEKVNAIISERHLALTEDPGKVQILENLIWQQVEEAHLDSDLGITAEEAKKDFDSFLAALHAYLGELSDTMIADGLHVLGQSPTGRRLTETIVQLTRVAGPDRPSLRRAIAASLGYDFDEVTQNPGLRLFGGLTGAQVIESIHKLSVALVDKLSEHDFVFSQAREELIGLLAESAALGDSFLSPASIPAKADGSGPAVKEDNLNEESAPAAPDASARFKAVLEVLRHISQTLVPDIKGSTAELTNTLAALGGGFVPPGPSGAPSRGQTDILPTGRNFYSVDPRKIPSPAAWEVGQRLGQALIERCLAETGNYPRNVGILVYGTSTMRSRGDDIAEILFLWGLKPVWRSAGTVEGLEVIPLSELGRPRIDVTARISGFFRDSFPNLVDFLDRAAIMAATLSEPVESNFIRAHVLTDMEAYRLQGRSQQEAFREATFRVFGCPPGTYGAGVAELVESGRWQDRDELGEIYIRWSGHAYGEGSYGLVRPEGFRRVLSRMDVTVKNEDSREYDMMSCTDYYNYYGGLIAASRAVRGVEPLSLMGDSSDQVRVRTTHEEAKHVLRSRLVNPKWLDGLKRHGFKGAGDISHMMDTLYGWDATANVVEDWMYEKAAWAWALEPETRQWMDQVNPFARRNILEKLLEAIARGLWENPGQLAQTLRDEFLELEGQLEDYLDPEGQRELS
ncbi:MAG: cobaltochelatase subunit CobN [Deltaproteobacteria bacterium]|jgi:cobaltochelatase CobN|nr:cobaltochelatase subunit CobN [Deltaproteobacteria bacterium]